MDTKVSSPRSRVYLSAKSVVTNEFCGAEPSLSSFILLFWVRIFLLYRTKQNYIPEECNIIINAVRTSDPADLILVTNRSRRW